MVRLATDPAPKKGKKKHHIHPSPPTKRKKGRPSKADLARRCQESSGPRRSLRPVRRRRIEEEYDDYFDFDSESEGEAAAAKAKRREKKLRLVLKFPPIDNNSNSNNKKPSFVSGGGGGAHCKSHSDSSSSGLSATAAAAAASDEDEKPLKKRRIDPPDDDLDDDDDDFDREGDAAADDDGDDDNVFDDDGDIRSSRSDDENEGRENEVGKPVDSVPASPADYHSGATPLPDKKALEFILHKLQKKDTYGVYAEPVDPKELPDYHDIIEHPMDFGTVKKKLARSEYSTLEQFESDVCLICTNAMRYNAPETIYFKQARSIQELARKRFQRLRAHARAPMESKYEQKSGANSVVKSVKKPMCRSSQEPVGSDFSSGATLAAIGDTCTWSKTTQAGGLEKPGNADGFPADGNSFLAENKHEKADEFSVKGLPLKFGKKHFVVDENRRASYNEPDPALARTESVFATFENETKQLVAVGLHADHSYARSLARFAATLGPVAWRVASTIIEQALPAGYKFGRGWVGEYEPPPTPVLLLEKKHIQMQLTHHKNLQNGSQSRKDGMMWNKSRAAEDISSRSVQLGLGASCVEAVSKGLNLPMGVTAGVTSSEGKPGWSGIAVGTRPVASNIHLLRRNSLNMDLAAKTDSDVVKEAISASVGTASIDTASQKSECGSGMTTYRSQEMVPMNRNPVWIQQGGMGLRANDHFSQAGIPTVRMDGGVVAGALPNGKALNNSDVNGVGNPTLNFDSNLQAGAPSYFGHGNHEQGLTDPVKLMRRLSGKYPNQPNTANPSMVNNPQVLLPFSSSRRDEPSAAATAARAWMSVSSPELKQTGHRNQSEMQIAAASLFNPTRELPNVVFRPHGDASGSMVLHAEKNRFPSHVLQQPTHIVTEELQFQNSRTMVFPQLSAANLSRFPVQSPWRGLAPHTQQRQKMDMLPPDLNIGFQSPGSPVQQSPRVRVDSQQPDLALQL